MAYLYLYLIFLVQFIPNISPQCVHDQLPKPVLITKDVNYGNVKSARSKRVPQNLYEPLRIHPIFELSFELSNENKTSVKEAINKANGKIKKLFSVLPVKGNLVLKRSACLLMWKEGPNKNRCYKMKKGYRGEYCLEHFRIPMVHLEGFNLYDRSNISATYEVYEQGVGVPDTDFILYITSQTTTTCQRGDRVVYGYAANCQVDQNGRPIAGVVNFCPATLKQSKEYTQDHLYITALHEMFHALGFSKTMFTEFRDCSKSEDGSNCPTQSQPVLRPVDGVTRLTTPSVKQKTQQHFACRTEAIYGGPMDSKNNIITSHWDSRIMHGSLMMSQSVQPHLTYIDEITLAVFEDSGWYKVDYSQADRFLWGKGQGCKFGLKEYCGSQREFFCQGSGNGCDYMALDKGVCRTDTHIKPCRIYTPSSQDQCFKKFGVRYSNDYGETFSESSRCFVSSLFPKYINTSEIESVGRCYEHRCKRAGHVQIKLRKSDWIDCLPGSSIQITGYSGSIVCPSNPHILCSEDQLVTSTAAHTQSTTHRIRDPDFEAIPIKIFFSQDNLTQLMDPTFRSQFEASFIRKVISVIPVSRERIQNFSADPENNTVTFWLHPPNALNNVSSEDIEYQLEMVVLNGRFWVHVEADGKNSTFYANGISNRSEISIWLNEKKVYNPGHGLKSDILIGTIVGSIVFIALAISVFLLINKRTTDIMISPDISSVSASPATPRPSPYRKNRALGASSMPSIEESQEFIPMEIDDSQAIEVLV
ncbi:hypothetical protein SNE40_011122 [Patella caerulea]|uniref:Leishmanolysin-like peptidase n=1 Tax=Patella caerulea TaxID=87958 RepID=A0AAN8JRN7_PATCE